MWSHLLGKACIKFGNSESPPRSNSSISLFSMGGSKHDFLQSINLVPSLFACFVAHAL